MAQWEYTKIDLGALPARSSDIDLLNNAGKDGWELVAITTNNIAYLKRTQNDAASAAKPRPKPPARTPTS